MRKFLAVFFLFLEEELADWLVARGGGAGADDEEDEAGGGILEALSEVPKPEAEVDDPEGFEAVESAIKLEEELEARFEDREEDEPLRELLFFSRDSIGAAGSSLGIESKLEAS